MITLFLLLLCNVIVVSNVTLLALLFISLVNQNLKGQCFLYIMVTIDGNGITLVYTSLDCNYCKSHQGWCRVVSFVIFGLYEFGINDSSPRFSILVYRATGYQNPRA